MKILNFNSWNRKGCANLPNKWVNFIFICKFCKKMRCFHEKFTQFELFLHDRRSRRSRQISSLTIGSEIGSPPYRSSSLAINGGINSHPMRAVYFFLFRTISLCYLRPFLFFRKSYYKNQSIRTLDTSTWLYFGNVCYPCWKVVLYTYM